MYFSTFFDADGLVDVTYEEIGLPLKLLVLANIILHIELGSNLSLKSKIIIEKIFIVSFLVTTAIRLVLPAWTRRVRGPFKLYQ